PAIDPIREQLVMSLGMNLGPRRNLLDATPEHARQIRIEQPVLTASTFAVLTDKRLRPVILEALFHATGGADALESAVESLCNVAAAAARAGAELLILSDDGVNATWAPIPSLLAVSAVHHHLILERLRSSLSIVVRTAEARDVSQLALLIGYGASAVYPSLAFETLSDLVRHDMVSNETDVGHAHAAYIKAVNKGLLKIMSKMGISTLQSYCGAQTFEAVGLSRELMRRFFVGTTSRLGGTGRGFDVIADETLRRHARAYG